MAGSNIVGNFTNGTVTLIDGTTPTAVELVLDLDNGDFSADGLMAKLNEIATYERRGSLVAVAHTTRTYPSGSMSAMAGQFTEAVADGTAADFILQRGPYAANVSTLGAGCPYHIHIKFELGLATLGGADDDFTLEDNRVTLGFSEGDPNNFAMSWVTHGAVLGDLACSE